MKMLKLFFILSLIIPFSKSYALLGVRIQPIIGLERIEKLSPEVKTKTRTIVGMRAMLGPSLLSLEGEGTRSEDSEYLFAQNIKETETSQALKVGLRSTLNLVFLRFYVRGGGQARQSKYKRTENDVSTERKSGLRISPYAGAGFTVNFLGNFFGSGGVTVVFSGKPKGSDREYQTTLGFGVRL